MTMVGKRRKSRELAMQMLFQADVGRQNPDEVRKTFWQARDEAEESTRGFAEELFQVATTRGPEIDAILEQHSKNWRIHRMPAVDRNLLRAAVAELIGFPGTPAPIVIDEALEIARRYCAPESIDFLNAVLDAIAKSRL
ncbi:MAG TPA: transcription antitermination factor NusB [Acidobacteriaceae bacterium]|nr:transcription antitermination factor NusB [Acidobacteriaceae bacterium]